MKTVIIFCSYGGSTRKYASEEAAKRGADLIEVKEKHPRSQFRAFLACPLCMMRLSTRLKEAIPDLSAYERIVIAAPVWAGYPVLPFNNILKAIPKGKELEVVLLSGGGETPESKGKTIQLLKDKGFNVISYTDIKTGVGIDISQQ